MQELNLLYNFTQNPNLCESSSSYNSMNFSQDPNLWKSLISYIIPWISHKNPNLCESSISYSIMLLLHFMKFIIESLGVWVGMVSFSFCPTISILPPSIIAYLPLNPLPLNLLSYLRLPNLYVPCKCAFDFVLHPSNTIHLCLVWKFRVSFLFFLVGFLVSIHNLSCSMAFMCDLW